MSVLKLHFLRDLYSKASFISFHTQDTLFFEGGGPQVAYSKLCTGK